MLKLFTMIFEGFSWFFSLFGRFALFASSFAKYSMFQSAIKIFFYGLFSAFIFMIVGFTGFFFYFIVSNILRIYNMVSYFLSVIGELSSAGNGIASTMFYFFSISGVTAGFKSFFPFLASALLFLLVKALYRVALLFYGQIMRVISLIVSII